MNLKKKSMYICNTDLEAALERTGMDNGSSPINRQMCCDFFCKFERDYFPSYNVSVETMAEYVKELNWDFEIGDNATSIAEKLFVAMVESENNTSEPREWLKKQFDDFLSTYQLSEGAKRDILRIMKKIDDHF